VALLAAAVSTIAAFGATHFAALPRTLEVLRDP